MEKRRQAAEQAKAQRQQAAANATTQDVEDTSALDSLLEKLRTGNGVGRKARRSRPTASNRQAAPLTLDAESVLEAGSSGDNTADIARDMLARLKSDGFNAITPSSPTSSTTNRSTRRSRRKLETSGFKGIAEELGTAPIFNLQEPSFDDSQENDEPPGEETEGGEDLLSVVSIGADASSETVTDDSQS